MFFVLHWPSGFSRGEDGRSRAHVTGGLTGAKEEEDRNDKKQTKKASSGGVKCYWKQ